MTMNINEHHVTYPDLTTVRSELSFEDVWDGEAVSDLMESCDTRFSSCRRSGRPKTFRRSSPAAPDLALGLHRERECLSCLYQVRKIFNRKVGEWREMVHSLGMKISGIAAILLCSSTPMAVGQMNIPPNPMVNPKNFKTRPIGGGIIPGAVVEPAKQPVVRQITHIVLCDYRMWSNTEGKPLEAKLIAFEDLVTETPAGAAEPAMPQAPAHPTVQKNGKIRLLVKSKPVEVALAKLSVSDQEFIAQMEAALAKKAASGH